MTITANYIISKVWELANTDPSKTGGKTGSQKRAFKMLLDIGGGVEFIVSRPVAELEELARRGVCSARVGTVLRELARVELQRRRALIDLADFTAQSRRLIREATEPRGQGLCSQNLLGAVPVSRSAHVLGKRQKACSRNR